MQSHIKLKFRFKCIIGILPFERKKKQKLVIKLKAKSDEFLNYARVLNFVKQSYKKQKFHTLEESLEFLSEALKKEFPALNSLKISAFKPKIIKNSKVGVSFKKKFKT